MNPHLHTASISSHSALEIKGCPENTKSALRPLANETRLVISVIGPYGRHGEPMFAVCAESGTHYVDVTGEVPFVARMISKYAEKAHSSGALMFPQTGFESAPADLVTWELGTLCRRLLGVGLGETMVSLESFE